MSKSIISLVSIKNLWRIDHIANLFSRELHLKVVNRPVGTDSALSVRHKTVNSGAYIPWALQTKLILC